MRPSNTTDSLRMEVTVLLVEHKRGKSFNVGGRLEYFCFEATGDKEEFGVGGEGHCSDFIPEIEVRHNYFTLHIDDETESVSVN